MADKNAALLKTHPHLEDFLPLLDTHNAESARGKVLVTCSFLEDQLRQVIAAFMVEGSDRDRLLEGFNAPLGTFSSRIVMAHCLGLISDAERDDCNTLRKIRNEFAHNHRADFTDQRIVDLCANLHHAAKPYGEVTVDAPGQFSTAGIGLILSLVNRPHYVGKARLARRDWPN